ncbi:DUF943 family protein [Erwinia sp. CPCC 100877]|nr:DUF943 family protein [Erwinia sp. CPCC 100877]
MNKRLIAVVIAAVVCGYLLWQFLTPVEIVEAHGAICSETGPCHNDILLVRHFPYLKSRQIAWWEDHRDIIQAKYGIPHKDDKGYYSITIMGFGKGFRTKPNESLLFSTDEVYCFEDMVTEAKCIDRDTLFSVDETPNGGLRYQSH